MCLTDTTRNGINVVSLTEHLWLGAGGCTSPIVHFLCLPKENEPKERARPVFCFLKSRENRAASPRNLRGFAASTRLSFSRGTVFWISYESKKGRIFRLRPTTRLNCVVSTRFLDLLRARRYAGCGASPPWPHGRRHKTPFSNSQIFKSSNFQIPIGTLAN